MQIARLHAILRDGISNAKLPPASKVVYPDCTSKDNTHSFSNPVHLFRFNRS
jgi:hypothetical protein